MFQSCLSIFGRFVLAFPSRVETDGCCARVTVIRDVVALEYISVFMPGNQQRNLFGDGFSRLISVCEVTNASGNGSCPNSLTGYLTKYAYNALGMG